jgi:hypothetical protein
VREGASVSRGPTTSVDARAPVYGREAALFRLVANGVGLDSRSLCRSAATEPRTEASTITSAASARTSVARANVSAQVLHNRCSPF